MRTIRLLLTALLCVVAKGSLAHTRLVVSVPADWVVIESSPASVTLTVSAAVRIVKLTLNDSAGAAIEIDRPETRDPETELVIALPALPAGDDVVDWSFMGRETHKVSGTLGFVVRAGQ
jgi:methionine-rich copper-binding protein CopC